MEKDLQLLGNVSYLYLMYKKGIVHKDLQIEIHSLYHTQLCDSSLLELFTPLMTYLHHPDDFITAFENPSLQGIGMSALIWRWLHSVSSSLYHLLADREETEELIFSLLTLFLSLSAAKNFSFLENDLWKWSSPSRRELCTLFPNSICNYFYWKNFHNNALQWEACKEMLEEFVNIFPDTLQQIPLGISMQENMKKNFEIMKVTENHWPSGPHGWPSAMKSSIHGGKWLQEMKEHLLAFFSSDDGFTTLCREIEESSLLINYVKELFSLFTSPLDGKNLQKIFQTLDHLPSICEKKNEEASRLFSSLLAWKNKFLHATSFGVEYFDPQKRVTFFGKVPEPLEFSLFHPEQVEVTLFSEKGNHYSTTLFFLFTKNILFKGLPNPIQELEEAFLKIS